MRAFLERRFDLPDESRRATGGELASRLRAARRRRATGRVDERFLELLEALKSR